MTTFRHKPPDAARLARVRLYVILGDDVRAGESPFTVARAAVRGGARAIQVRLKGRSTADVVAFTERVRDAVGDAALVIVNDDVEAALSAGASGVHVGQDDAAIEDIRARCGDRLLVGVSTHSREQALAAKASGADAIGIGAMFPTTTKAAPVLIGPEVLRGLVDELGALPIFPIGGINERNVVEIARRGVGRAAVASAVTHADDPERAAARLVELLSNAPLPGVDA